MCEGEREGERLRSRDSVESDANFCCLESTDVDHISKKKKNGNSGLNSSSTKAINKTLTKPPVTC